MGEMNLATLPNEVGSLKNIIVELNEQLLHEKTEAEKTISILKEQVAFFQDKLYGPRSEKWSEADRLQMRLFNEAEAEAGVEQANEISESFVNISPFTRRKAGRKPLPQNLPRVEVIHELEEEDRVCACGAQLTQFGTETSEQLDIIPAQIRVIRHIRYKYACRECEGLESEDGGAVKIAPVPHQMIPKSIASAGLLAHVITSKFVDALPFYRQEKQFLRLGVHLKRATMCLWAMRVALRYEMLLELLHEEILSGPLVRIDETPVQVLNEPEKAATTKSYMWVFVGGPVGKPAVVFLYHPTRSGSVPLEYLQGYQGYVQTDGYTAYDELGRQPGIIMLGCMAHARRKFYAVIKASKNAKSALEALSRIKKLYAIEHEAKDRELEVPQIEQLRQEKSIPILDAFKVWLDNKVEQAPPKSLLGKAVGYSLGQWDRLIRYVENGILSPDNNIAENIIRPFVIGRKNWLFSYHPQGAAASAGHYSMIQSAVANGLEPYFYLRYLYDRLPLVDGNRDELKKLLPQYVDKEKVRNQDIYEPPKPP
jgi:transposase|tara:strand:+ start:879 stop:2495 length:1617 start_codon:yes stop_codon:yes gene_type:complete